jgi:hypothetical protein
MQYFLAPFSRQSVSVHPLIALLALGLLVVPTLPGFAQDTAPPSGRSSGTRGCGTTTLPVQMPVPGLILLAPAQQPGKTASVRPTFAWFVRDAEGLPMEFRLYAQTGNGFQLVKEIKGDRLRSKPGIMVLPPDPAMPELIPGKTYRWQVELVCNPDHPSGNLFATSDLQVVPLHSQLKSQLQHQRDRTKQAQLYAQANLWYDSLSVAFSPATNSTDLKDLQLSLLSRVAINPSEQALLQSSPVRWFTP